MDNIKWPYNIKKLKNYEERWNIDLDLITNENQNLFEFQNLEEVIVKLKKKI